MVEGKDGWEVYDQAQSDEVEEAHQARRKAVTIMVEGKARHIDLKHMQETTDATGTTLQRVRRQQLSKGMSRMWQVLSTTFAPPYWLRGRVVDRRTGLTHAAPAQ